MRRDTKTNTKCSATEETPILSADNKFIKENDTLYFLKHEERRHYGRECDFQIGQYKVLYIDYKKRSLVLVCDGRERHLLLPDDSLESYYKDRKILMDYYQKTIDEKIENKEKEILQIQDTIKELKNYKKKPLYMLEAGIRFPKSCSTC